MTRIFLHMDDSVEPIDCFPGVATSRDSIGFTMEPGGEACAGLLLTLVGGIGRYFI